MTNADCEDGRLLFGRMHTVNGTLVLARSITVNHDFHWYVQVDGKTFHPQHFGASELLNSASTVGHVIAILDRHHICSGNPDDKFLPLVVARKGKFMGHSGTVVSYCMHIKGTLYFVVGENVVAFQESGPDGRKTIRTSGCLYLVPQPGCCSVCTKYRKILHAMLHRTAKQPSDDKFTPTNPHSSANVRYLTTPQKAKRYKRIRLSFKDSQLKLERLRANLADLVQERSVEVDSELHHDMLKMMEECSPMV